MGNAEPLIRPATLDDAHDLAPRLRWADQQELEACGTDPLSALVRGATQSIPCRTIEFKGYPAAMYGVLPVPRDPWPDKWGSIDGVVWLLGADDLTLFSRRFLRQSRDQLALISAGYRAIGNVIDVRNEVHMRWVDWLGVEWIRALKHGPQRLQFWKFRKAIRV